MFERVLSIQGYVLKVLYVGVGGRSGELGFRGIECGNWQRVE